jgi:predicted amidohydrolase
MRTRATRRVRHITVRVACAQLAARSVAHAPAALRDVLGAIRHAKRHDADLVVLPECSYPGYVLLDDDPYRRHIPSDVEALAAVAREARRSAIDVCIGIARRSDTGALRNEAVYIDAHGEQLCSYAKNRLWNFDHRWFSRGRALPVFQSRFGTIGMMICADGRNPEIARTLVASGASLILDPTAWVGSGPTHEAIHNPQADYALRARAVENGVWIAAADKCGSELGVVHYAGRSQVVAPSGEVVAIADSTSPQIVIGTVHLSKAKPFVAALSAADRRTLRSRPQVTFDTSRMPPRLWIGIYQSARNRRDDPLALQAIRAQGAQALISTGAGIVAVKRALARARGLRFAIICDTDMVAPEPARAAALRGADLLVWLRPPPRRLPILEIARTRALENRVYVALCTRADDAVAACLVGPDGSVTGSALTGRASGFVAVVDTILARRKELVPGTQTFADRMPSIYRWLDRNISSVRRDP